MSVRKSGKIIAGTPRTTGGVEIGDMGFAPLGIDESLNLRRYLNGQLISQTQFVSFTNKIKSAIALYPNLATTEANWQAEKTNSKLGQCGKFVIDDTAGTIRLPAVVNAQGLLSLSGIGNLVNESLPNINGGFTVINDGTGSTIKDSYGCCELSYTSKNDAYISATQSTTTYGVPILNINASRSSSTYQNNAPVQQEAVQYPYYIQVATGIEETLPAIREYNINTPFFFGQSMYSDAAPDNASWLASNGSYNSRSVYPDYYDWLVEQMNAGVSGLVTSVMYAYSPSGSGIIFTLPTLTPKVGMVCYGYSDGSYENIPLSVITSVTDDGAFQAEFQGTNYVFVRNSEKDQTTSYPTDYDFVINTTDQTFRLPLLNGEEDLPGNTSIDLAIQASDSTYTASANGTVFFGSTSTATNQFVALQNNTAGVSSKSLYSSGSNQSFKALLDVKRGDVFMVAYQTSPEYLRFIPAVGNGSLYYYVGDTVQDASLINAGAVLGQLSNKADIDASNFNADGKSLLSGLSCMSNGVLISQNFATGTNFTAPDNGWFKFRGVSTASPSRCFMANVSVQGVPAVGGDTPASGALNNIMLRVKKGDMVSFQYTNLNISYDESSGAWFYQDVGEI